MKRKVLIPASPCYFLTVFICFLASLRRSSNDKFFVACCLVASSFSAKLSVENYFCDLKENYRKREKKFLT
jgi:hypothetical protein